MLHFPRQYILAVSKSVWKNRRIIIQTISLDKTRKVGDPHYFIFKFNCVTYNIDCDFLNSEVNDHHSVPDHKV
jgi:hypothetical protein